MSIESKEKLIEKLEVTLKEQRVISNPFELISAGYVVNLYYTATTERLSFSNFDMDNAFDINGNEDFSIELQDDRGVDHFILYKYIRELE